ncbi:MAG: DNA-binding protein [Clostridia bacterium]|nr:DNA-binding protein [Clostridia bacterium]
MAEKIFMRVDEVAEELDVSVPYAYKLIRKMNEELKKTGCITIAGRIDRKFFYEKFYGTRENRKEEANGGI